MAKQSMILDPRDKERLWKELAPLIKRASDLKQDLTLYIAEMATSQAEDASSTFFEMLYTHLDALHELERVRYQANTIREAFVPQYPMVPLT